MRVFSSFLFILLLSQLLKFGSGCEYVTIQVMIVTLDVDGFIRILLNLKFKRLKSSKPIFNNIWRKAFLKPKKYIHIYFVTS